MLICRAGGSLARMSTGGYELVAAVLAFSVVQSVFGVGLLVFGTPTLLLAGYSFEETLAYLLPCSMAISALQVRDGGLSFEPVRRDFVLFTAPAVLAGAHCVRFRRRP